MKLGITDNQDSQSSKLSNSKKVSGDILGNIALLKFSRDETLAKKKKVALDFLKRHKSVTTILEKTGKFSGRLRTLTTKWLAGDKTKEALYKESGCLFRFNVDTCYFSPRLSTEREKVAAMVKRGEDVLVMFGGVGPFAIIIGKHTKAKNVVSMEIGRECSKYAKINVKRNKLNNVEIIRGDVKKQGPKLKKKFNRIVMARPNLKDSFLDVAFPLVKKGGIINYYGFYLEVDKGKMIEMIKEEAKKAKKKIKILRTVKAGEIGSRKYRYRVDIKVY